jgi:lauroyl/myristoyl acyltransferase
MMHNDSNIIEKFYFDSLPAPVKSIQSYTRKFYRQEKVKVNQNQAGAVQQIILQHPELWLWIYKRWEICPDGEKYPYQREGL